jgi:two-component system C4-dicarboxylate transport sensor histidine kinase DctB
MDERGVRLVIDIPDSLETTVERARAERVFFNLFSNSLDAMPEGGQIRIWTERTAGGIEVRLQDTGPGIPAAIRNQMFRPFVTSKRSGLGLGLTLSRQMMVEMGGNLSVVDRAGGACFTVLLPGSSSENAGAPKDIEIASR